MCCHQSSSTLPIILVPAVSVISVVLGWWLNERSKRKESELIKRRERYEELILAIKGFYEADPIGISANAAKQTFINQINLAWLYCSDEFIRKANQFLDSVSIEEVNQDMSKKLLGELMVIIRKDFISESSLIAKDFKTFAAKDLM
jgi:hypothetical protein